MRQSRVNPYGHITKQTYHFINWTQKKNADLLYRIQKLTENLCQFHRTSTPSQHVETRAAKGSKVERSDL